MKKLGSGVMDMTAGNPYKLIVLFSLPLLVGNVFQQLYNMVDSIVVGNVVGEKALAAVSTGFPIIFALSSLFMGIGMGATVMISQFYGAKDLESIRHTVNTMYTALIIISVPLTLIGILLSDSLLRLMQVPDDGTLDMARTYMIVIFIGIIGTLGFNLNAGILQGFGDSRTSLLFLLIATIINIVLDLLFTAAMGMGVLGVALATIIAQIVSWLFGVWYLKRHYAFLKIRLLGFQFHKEFFMKAMKLGIPSGLQQMLFSIGIMTMQALVNGYGSLFMAGFSGANKIDSFAFMPIQSFATAMTTYTGQNVGAGKMDRVKSGTRAGLVLAIGFSLVLGFGLYPFGGFLMQMFNQNPDVIAAGEVYLHSVLPFYALLGIQFIYTAVLRGAGEMIVPMVSSFVSLWLARIPTAYILAATLGRDSIYYSYAIGWLFGVIIAFISYKRGKWKTKAVVKQTDTSQPVSQSSTETEPAAGNPETDYSSSNKEDPEKNPIPASQK